MNVLWERLVDALSTDLRDQLNRQLVLFLDLYSSSAAKEACLQNTHLLMHHKIALPSVVK